MNPMNETGLETIVESAPELRKRAASRLEKAGEQIIERLIHIKKFAFKPYDLLREYEELMPVLDEFQKAIDACEKSEIPADNFEALLQKISEAKKAVRS